MSAPCYLCEDRHPGCHGECEKYKAYDRERQRIREERKALRAISDARNEAITRWLRSVKNIARGKRM